MASVIVVVVFMDSVPPITVFRERGEDFSTNDDMPLILNDFFKMSN